MMLFGRVCSTPGNLTCYIAYAVSNVVPNNTIVSTVDNTAYLSISIEDNDIEMIEESYNLYPKPQLGVYCWTFLYTYHHCYQIRILVQLTVHILVHNDDRYFVNFDMFLIQMVSTTRYLTDTSRRIADDQM